MLKYVGNFTFESLNLPFKIYELDYDVISCAEAAGAKGISIKNELKTLVLETSSGICTVNVSAKDRVSLRQIKTALNVNEAYLASSHILNTLNLIPGNVCPFLTQLWKAPMLIDEYVLDLSFISTNKGVRNQFIIFSPQLLLLSPNHIVGNFIE